MNKRIINGLLLLNKPKDLTSNKVLQKVKHLFNASKAGHTGSLDPMATGMLPLCFGEATKFCQYLLDADKHYEVTALLGVKTNTGDATGHSVSTVNNFVVSTEQLQSVLLRFNGPIKQIPSMFSAIKQQGVPLYKLARAGIEVPRAPRDVCIHSLKLNEFDGRFFSLSVSCSKGTYIRNLVEDIGDALGVGAHVAALHRTHTTGFSEYPMHSLACLEQASEQELLSYLLPMDLAVAHFPKLEFSNDHIQVLRQGKTIKSDFFNQLGCVRLFQNQHDFVGLGEIFEMGVLKVKRLLKDTETVS